MTFQGVSIEMFSSNKLFENEKKFSKKIIGSPTWFFFNRKFKAKVRKFCSFDIYRKHTYRKTLSIDTSKDYMIVKNFIIKNNCLPGKNNLYNFYLKN